MSFARLVTCRFAFVRLEVSRSSLVLRGILSECRIKRNVLPIAIFPKNWNVVLVNVKTRNCESHVSCIILQL